MFVRTNSLSSKLKGKMDDVATHEEQRASVYKAIHKLYSRQAASWDEPTPKEQDGKKKLLGDKNFFTLLQFGGGVPRTEGNIKRLYVVFEDVDVRCYLDNGRCKHIGHTVSLTLPEEQARSWKEFVEYSGTQAQEAIDGGSDLTVKSDYTDTYGLDLFIRHDSGFPRLPWVSMKMAKVKVNVLAEVTGWRPNKGSLYPCVRIKAAAPERVLTQEELKVVSKNK